MSIRFAPALLLALAGSALGQARPFDLPAPYDGAYFDPTQPGLGLWLDNGPDGLTFGALMYYAPDGRPTFATFASPLGTTGSLAEAFSGVRGLRGPLWESVDGQCLGCPHRLPVSRPIEGDLLAEISHRAARVSYFGTQFQMQAIPIGRTDPQLFEGTWWLTLDDLEVEIPVASAFREGRELSAVVRMVPVGGVAFVPAPVPDSDLDHRYPNERSFVYEVQCVASCWDFNAWRSATGPTTRVFAHGRPSTSQFATGAFGRYVESPAGYAIPNGTHVHAVKLDPWRMHSRLTHDGAPRMVLYRSPIVAPCDGGDVCRSTATRAQAEAPSPYDNLDPWAHVTRTLTGAWYDPEQGGTGLWIDAGRDGNTFMTLMTYAARHDGGAEPAFYTLGNPIVADPPSFSCFAPCATVRTPLYESRDGQQLGGPWRAPTTRIATELGTAVIRVGANAVTLALPNAFYDMVPLVADRAIVDLPRGRWLLSLRDQLAYGGSGEPPAGEPYALVEELTAEVELVAGAINALTPPDNRALPLQPTAEARTYSVVCRASCADFDAWRQGALVGLWVLPSGYAVLSQLDANRVPLSGGRQYELSVHEDVIEGTGFPLVLPDRERRQNLARVRMEREPPPGAFCDADADCG